MHTMLLPATFIAMSSTSYHLPGRMHWPHTTAVAEYAQLCLESLGLADWSFTWDRATKRMGCCRPAKKIISLSIYYVQKYIGADQDEIYSTLLHEISHALAWTRARARGHGDVWKHYCHCLGLSDTRATKNIEDFTPPHLQRTPRYALCHAQTGEIFRYYKSYPRSLCRKLSHCYIPGRQNETLGQLIIKPIPPESAHGDISPKKRES